MFFFRRAKAIQRRFASNHTLNNCPPIAHRMESQSPSVTLHVAPSYEPPASPAHPPGTVVSFTLRCSALNDPSTYIWITLPLRSVDAFILQVSKAPTSAVSLSIAVKEGCCGDTQEEEEADGNDEGVEENLPTASDMEMQVCDDDDHSTSSPFIPRPAGSGGEALIDVNGGEFNMALDSNHGDTDMDDSINSTPAAANKSEEEPMEISGDEGITWLSINDSQPLQSCLLPSRLLKIST